jgi:hypothetical protein
MVTSIGSYAFADYGTEPLTVTMGAAPPTVGTSLFDSYGTSAEKIVNVRVPSASLSLYNDAAWQNAFKGLGNTDGNIGMVNENITVTVISQ